MEDKAHFEELIEEGVVSEEESASSSSSSLSIGKRLPGLVVPLVEALVVGKKNREDGTSDISLILAPHVKKGVWIKATLTIKNSSKLSRKSVEKYRYPLVWGAKLALDAVRNKGDNDWVRNTIEDINSYTKEGSKNKEVEEEEVIEEKKSSTRRQKSLSSHDSGGSKDRDKSDVYRSPQRRSRRIPALRKWSREFSDKESRTPRRSEEKKARRRTVRNSIWGTNPRMRRDAYKAIRSSSDSLGSTTKGDLEDKEVWDTEEEDDGMVFCPFTNKDIRRFIDVKESIKGKAVERRFTRQALHNLYRHFTSLQTFVDSIRTKGHQPASIPFAVDLIWLEYHAMYIDALLFENLKGMWATWNEPVLDLLVRSFLELMVRCMPRRQYPDKLEERVRRWMKKNQVGISTAFGPLPYFLQNAKATERGINVSSPPAVYYGRSRFASSGGGRGEGRGRGGMVTGSNNRRGGSRAEGKTNSNE